jgi:hypothetical protein
MRTVTLYRPVGPKELELIQASGWREFPPRSPDQPIFYPVTNEDYAVQIARDWNVKASGAGFVTKFEVQSDYLSRFSVQQVGGALHTEYWIPTEDLHMFNENIVGEIQVILLSESFISQRCLEVERAMGIENTALESISI